MPITRTVRIARARLIALLDGALGLVAAGGLRLLRLFDRRRMADFCGAALRRLGPWLPEHHTGRANLAAAFPKKSSAEIEAILRGAWDNLGRFAADFAHLDRITVKEPAAGIIGDIDYSAQTLARFEALRTSGKPALIFAAHLGNWELPALVAARFGLDSAVLYRRPNLQAAADAVVRMRGRTMGTLIATGFDAPLRIAQALEEGKTVGMLVDQYLTTGVPVTFFGRRTRANPTIVRIARRVECPIHGVCVRRLPGGRFEIVLTEAIAPARDDAGKLDVDATMQIIFDIIENWIRETPEQWLWQHRRWRPQDSTL